MKLKIGAFTHKQIQLYSLFILLKQTVVIDSIFTRVLQNVFQISELHCNNKY
jgi:hypothetical protein